MGQTIKIEAILNWDNPYVPGNPGKHRKHTPIVSERQRRFFGAEYGRAKRGEERETGMSKAEMRRHLKEVSGKELPEAKKKKK